MISGSDSRQTGGLSVNGMSVFNPMTIDRLKQVCLNAQLSATERMHHLSLFHLVVW